MNTTRLMRGALALTVVGACGCAPTSPAGSAPASVATQTVTQTTTAHASAPGTPAETGEATASAQPGAGDRSAEPGAGGAPPTAPFMTPAPASVSAHAPALCVAEDLEVTHASDPDGTGAGKIGIALRVKNIGTVACQLGEPDGQPQIALVTGPASVERIGAPARYVQPPQDRVVIEPGASVATSLQIVRAENIGDCRVTPAWALAVFAVQGRAAVTPVEQLNACAGSDHALISARGWSAA